MDMNGRRRGTGLYINKDAKGIRKGSEGGGGTRLQSEEGKNNPEKSAVTL